MATRNVNIWKSIDHVTVILYLALFVCGWFSICGASYDFTTTDFFSFSTRPGKQLVWLGTALVVMVVMTSIEKKYYEMAAYIVYAAFMLLLLITPFIAKEIKGSQSWIHLFGPVNVQPCEFAKCATALALGRLVSTYGFSIQRRSDMLKALGIIVLPILLIVMEKETGSALVYLAFILVLYREGLTGAILLVGVAAVAYFVIGISKSEVFFENMPSNVGTFWVMILITVFTSVMLAVYARDIHRALRVLLANILTTVIAVLFARFYIPFNVCIVQIVMVVLTMLYLITAMLYERRKTYLLIALFTIGSLGFFYSCNYVFTDILQPHQQQRIQVSLGIVDDNSGAGYNVNQAKIAIGSGGLTGKGFLNGTQTKLNYVPEQETDFIFCTIGEEKGFLGCLGLLVLYLVFILRLLVLAERQGRNRFARVFGYSLVCILTTHLFINVGMVLGLLPVIGIPLPFISYGGSSLWGFTIILSIFLRFDAERETV